MDHAFGTGRMRWLLVLAPLAAVAGLEIVSDTLLDEALPFPWDTVLVVATIVVMGAALGALAFRRIDALTGTLRRRNAELEARGASARALHRVSLAIAALSDVDRVLDAVVGHARSLLDADAAVLLLDAGDGGLQLRASDIRGQPRPDALAASPGAVPRASSPQVSGDPADAILRFVDPGLAVSRLGAPLQRGSETIGLLCVGRSVPGPVDADDLETLASLASQAAIALEHARLEGRLRDLAVVEERERIARELHDGIAQVLGYVNTKSLAIDGYLADGRVDEARVQVAELGAAARAVYVDVREAIVGLRSPVEPGLGLGEAVERHARRVAADSGFSVEVAIPPEAHDLRLDPEIERQVYRIVQEALTNVRKHAAARRVRVSAALVPGRLTIRIEDDGRGFPPAVTPPATSAQDGAPDVPRYGLRSMRERAAAIGGTLEVGDGPRGGVLVTLDVPIAARAQEGSPVDEPAGEPVRAGPRAAASRGSPSTADGTG